MSCYGAHASSAGSALSLYWSLSGIHRQAERAMWSLLGDAILVMLRSSLCQVPFTGLAWRPRCAYLSLV